MTESLCAHLCRGIKEQGFSTDNGGNKNDHNTDKHIIGRFTNSPKGI